MHPSIVRLESVESTNFYCEALDLATVGDFTCFWAMEQTAGVGQRGSTWVSAPGMNLTFSLVLKPTFLDAAAQFKLTQTLSLGVADFLDGLSLPQQVAIKWPNDIYVGDRKICGILVSNRIMHNRLSHSICGMGMNVNQTSFPSWVPNPVSLAMLTNHHHSLESTLDAMLRSIAHRYDDLRQGIGMDEEYHRRLLRFGTEASYICHGETCAPQ